MLYYVTTRNQTTWDVAKVHVFSDEVWAQRLVCDGAGVRVGRGNAEVDVWNGAVVVDRTDGGDEASRELMRLVDIERGRDAIEAYCEDCGVDVDGTLGWFAVRDALDAWPDGGAWGDGITAIVHLSSGTTDPRAYEWPWELAADVYSMMVQDSMRGVDPRDTVWAEAVG